MRTTIWKFPLTLVNGPQLIQMPMDAVVRRVAMQGDSPCVWAEVDPESDRLTREFVVVGTGHRLPQGLFRYVGSCDHGVFVWHVYMNPRDADNGPG